MIIKSQNLKLFRIIFIQKSYRHSHSTCIIYRDIFRLIYIYRIIIIIFRIFTFISNIIFIKDHILMTFFYFDISKPDNITKFNKTCFFIINTTCKVLMMRYFEKCITSLESITKPKFIIFNKFKNFFVCNRILTSNNDKFFIIFEKLCDIFTKKGKWRISHHDISFFKYFDTLETPEVSILFQRSTDNIKFIDFSVIIPISNYL